VRVCPVVASTIRGGPLPSVHGTADIQRAKRNDPARAIEQSQQMRGGVVGAVRQHFHSRRSSRRDSVLQSEKQRVVAIGGKVSSSELARCCRAERRPPPRQVSAGGRREPPEPAPRPIRCPPSRAAREHGGPYRVHPFGFGPWVLLSFRGRGALTPRSGRHTLDGTGGVRRSWGGQASVFCRMARRGPGEHEPPSREGGGPRRRGIDVHPEQT